MPSSLKGAFFQFLTSWFFSTLTCLRLALVVFWQAYTSFKWVARSFSFLLGCLVALQIIIVIYKMAHLWDNYPDSKIQNNNNQVNKSRIILTHIMLRMVSLRRCGFPSPIIHIVSTGWIKSLKMPLATFQSLKAQLLDFRAYSPRTPSKVTNEWVEEENLALDVRECFEGTKGAASGGSASTTLDLGIVIAVLPMTS